MSANNFNDVVDSLLKGMGTLLSSHTVVGEPAQIGDMLILPLVDVSFGVGAGAGKAERKDNGSGGFGAKMSPSAVLIIKDGQTRLVNIKNQDAVTKILDLVPEVVNRFTKGNGDAGQISDDEAVDLVFGDRNEDAKDKEKDA